MTGKPADGTGKVYLWDLVTGQQEGAPLRGVFGITASAFSPDGMLLASAGLDGTVKLWEPLTGKQVGATLPPGAPFRGNGADAVIEVAFSPSGEILAASDGRHPEAVENSGFHRPVRDPLRRGRASVRFNLEPVRPR